MEKLFYCIWTDRDDKAINSYDHKEAQEPVNFFSEDRGYTKKDIEAINKLDIEESHHCEYGNHSIRRIK